MSLFPALLCRGRFRVTLTTALAALALTFTPTAQATTPAAAPTAPARTATTGCTTLKTPARGAMPRFMSAISRKNEGFRQYAGGFLIKVLWSDIERTPGVYDVTNIDRQIAYAAASGLDVRLLVLAGTSAPTDVKSIGGAPIPFFDHDQRIETTIGRFWLPEYQQRWQALQRALATAYDGNPLVKEVNISGTGLISAEVMLTMPKDVIPSLKITNAESMAAAGVTEPLRRSALDTDIALMQDTWTSTHTTLFANVYMPIGATATIATTREIISATHARKPGHTVFGHTGASSGVLAGTTMKHMKDLYLWWEANGMPYMLQTQTYHGGWTNEGVDDLAEVLQWAAAHHAMSVELPRDWQFDAAALAVLKDVNVALAANAAPFAAVSIGC